MWEQVLLPNGGAVGRHLQVKDPFLGDPALKQLWNELTPRIEKLLEASLWDRGSHYQDGLYLSAHLSKPATARAHALDGPDWQYWKNHIPRFNVLRNQIEFQMEIERKRAAIRSAINTPSSDLLEVMTANYDPPQWVDPHREIFYELIKDNQGSALRKRLGGRFSELLYMEAMYPRDGLSGLGLGPSILMSTLEEYQRRFPHGTRDDLETFLNLSSPKSSRIFAAAIIALFKEHFCPLCQV